VDALGGSDNLFQMQPLCNHARLCGLIIQGAGLAAPQPGASSYVR